MSQNDDSISRQAAIEAVEFGITYAKAIDIKTGEVRELFKESNEELMKAAERIKQLPSAQPDIIHCKDCAYCDSDVVDAPYGMTKKIFWCDRLYAGANENLIVEPDDFCSWAERREDAAD